ncbi:MAG: hypothetical protein JST93_25800 [Acidobacteria bacterium]|nr:hypothetical protein [Acidobacteriota bacterium]
MRVLRRGLGLALFVLLMAAFPWGPLFPLSPWKPGYEVMHLGRADVYVPSGIRAPAAYREIDSYMQRAEESLQLHAPKRLTVVLTPDWNHFRRLMPHMRSTGIGAVTLATGTVIYVTPKIEERKFDHGEYLRHEICHAVIHQTQGIVAAYRLTHVEWLSEGLAVWIGDQKSYFTKEEMVARARQGELLPVIDPSMRDARTFQIRYAYQVWRYFCEFIMEHYGREMFQRYLRDVMADPPAWKGKFEAVFGESLENAVKRYQEKLRT